MAIDPVTGIDDEAAVATPMGGGYADVLSQLADQRKQILDDKSDLADSSGDLSARAILGLAPIVLGAAFYGMKGANAGAQAGLAGNMAYQTLDDADSKERLALRKERIAAVNSDIKDAQMLQRQDLGFAQQNKLADKRNAALTQGLAGRGANAIDSSPEFAKMRDEAVERAKKMGLPADVADDLLTARNSEELNKIQDNIRSDSQTKQATLLKDVERLSESIGKSSIVIGDKKLRFKIEDEAQLPRLTDKKTQQQLYQTIATTEEVMNSLITMRQILPKSSNELQQVLANRDAAAAVARQIVQTYNLLNLDVVAAVKDNPVFAGVLSNQDLQLILRSTPPPLATDADPVEWLSNYFKNNLAAAKGGIDATLSVVQPKFQRSMRRYGISLREEDGTS